MSITRRSFVQQAAAAAALSVAARSQAQSTVAPDRQYHELRCYRLQAGSRLTSDAALEPLDRYLEHSLLPALEHRGIRDVGAFTEVDVQREDATTVPKPGTPVWVLITHPALESFVATAAELPSDPESASRAGDYLGARKARPAFERIDVWLYRAFASWPQLAVPSFSRTRVPTRIFEMRDFESHSERAASNKIAMFDQGESALMQDLGMNPVFFGQALCGADLPHLRYITGGPDLAGHLARWGRFGSDPRWAALRDDPQYADNMTRNTARFLAPRPYSSI